MVERREKRLVVDAPELIGDERGNLRVEKSPEVGVLAKDLA